MKRVLLVVAYDGTNYHGWQIQPNGITIESELNRCLSELLGEDIKVSGASRTDTGVHALCNLAIFDTNTQIPADKISFAVNQRLPLDIRVVSSCEKEKDFHPRFVDTEKTYEYRILNSKYPNPIRRNYTHFCYYNLDVNKMNLASKLLLGEHDFKSFCGSNAQVESTIREITDISVEKIKLPMCDVTSQENSEIVIRVSGKGFLYNMVRIIAGTLIEIGRGAIDEKSMKTILEACDREAAGPTAPANGLTLVNYKFL